VNSSAALDDRTSELPEARRPTTIVLAIDGGDLAPRALLVAQEWALRFGALLQIFAVEGEHRRDEFAELVRNRPWSWKLVDRSAIVPSVVEVTSADQTAAVCVATRAHSPLIDALSDEIAQELLRSVDVPVLLVGPRCRPGEPGGPVVVAHDGSDADAVVDPARVWAGALGVPTVLLHVHQSFLGGLAEVMAPLEAARRRLGTDTLEVMSKSFPAGAIREYAHEVDASLIALSTRGRTSMLTASTGGTATWVVRESPCPVLVAHPRAGSRS
jgi:nucleotide-binding universal stress UspA family protein